MKLTPSLCKQEFGKVHINEVQRVMELDAGPKDASSHAQSLIESQLAIVISCMNEDYTTIDGVFSAIPRGCLIVFVSKSERQDPDDRYAVEARLLSNFCKNTGRYAICAHQKDSVLAEAFVRGGMPSIVSEDKLVRCGKGEAMIIGTALVAALTERKYVGYVDADNKIPGSVLEYCKVFVAGLQQVVGGHPPSPLAMVRVLWSSKPKVRDGGLVFEKHGRSSKVISTALNRLLQDMRPTSTGQSDLGPDCSRASTLIVTGNAGEHAMSLELGLDLRLAGRYAFEPFQLVDMLERYGGGGTATGADQAIQILQIQTRNPHFHDDKGDAHVRSMQLQGLGAIHQSFLASESLRHELVDLLGPGQTFPRISVYPPLNTLDFAAFSATLTSRPSSLVVYN